MAAATKFEKTEKEVNHANLGFRQFFDRNTCTYTYLLWDKESKEAILIDIWRLYISEVMVFWK